MDTSDFRAVQFSKTTLTELMIPSYTNFGGKIHGGVLLSLMDRVAYVCAAKHAGAYCVTASIDSVDFLAPVEVGELVSLKASVNYVGHSSLVVGIRVVSENVKTRIEKHTNTSYFTMVAMNDNHQPVKVPGLVLECEDDIRRFIETLKRNELKKEQKENMQKIKANVNTEQHLHLLQGERCIVKN